MKTRAMALCLIWILLILSVCPGLTEQTPEEHLVLTMYCIGDEGGPYAEEHLALVNRLLTERINVEIRPLMVSWSDYATRLPLIWASGEDYDLTYTSDWAGYSIAAIKGSYMDITELLPVYAPQTWQRMNERGAVSGVSVGGRIYMVPALKTDYTTHILEYREDLRKKYNCPEIVDDSTLGIYLQAVLNNETGMQPFGNNGVETYAFWNFLNENDWSRPIEQYGGFLVYDLTDPTHIFNITDTPEYEAFIRKMYAYRQNGFVSSEIMLQTVATRDLFKAGLTATAYANFSDLNADYAYITEHTDWEIGYYASDLMSGHTELMTPTSNGIALGAYCRHPERALRLIELINTDETVYHALVYGIEHVTYETDPISHTRWLPEGKKPEELYLMNLGMQFMQDEWDLTSLSDNPVVNACKEQYDACALVPALASFVLNPEKLTGQMAALSALRVDLKLPLEKGVIDPETGLTQLRAELEALGITSLLEEINAQLREYLETAR